MGEVDYDPYLSALDTDAPISPPTNVTKAVSGSDVVLSWTANSESDVAGYKLYYGNPTGYSYDNSVDLGNVTTHTVTDGDIGTEYAITAYDNSLDGTDDQVDGNESWYSIAKSPGVTLSSDKSILSEPSESTTITATIDYQSSADVVVNLSYSGTATNGTDYESAEKITISAGTKSGTTILNVKDDSSTELTETIIIDISSVSGASEQGNQQLTINLQDDDLTTINSIAIDKSSISEGEESVIVTASVDEVQSKEVTIPFSYSGTATENIDYENENWPVSTVAGGNNFGTNSNQLAYPHGLHVNSAGDIYIVNRSTHSVVKWAAGSESGVVVAGGSEGYGLDQLKDPDGIHIDSSGNIYIADAGSMRIVKWEEGASQGVVVAGQTNNQGDDDDELNHPKNIFVDSSGNIYISDTFNHRVMKWDAGASLGTLVAGGIGMGSSNKHLNSPRGIYVDSEGSIFIVDKDQHRVMKWESGSDEGIVVAGGNGAGSALNQLDHPTDLFFGSDGYMYISDKSAHRVVKWKPGANEGVVIAGGNGDGSSDNQLSDPQGVYLDNDGNLYVSDTRNHRIQKIQIAPQIKILAGQTSGSLKINIIDDKIDEDDETVILSPGTVEGANNSNSEVLTFTINDDDDPPTINFSQSAESIVENSSTDLIITATLSEASEKEIEIPFTVSGTADASEYTVSDSPLKITAGSLSGTITVSTNGKDDTDVEPIETIILNYDNLVNATTTFTSSTINLISDDVPDLSSIEVDKSEIFEHEKSIITATIAEAHARDTSVIFNISGTATFDEDYNVDIQSKNTFNIYYGGNGIGSEINQLNNPLKMFILIQMVIYM